MGKSVELMSKPVYITILGGGRAGLAMEYYVQKNGLPFTIYEASHQIGGTVLLSNTEVFYLI